MHDRLQAEEIVALCERHGVAGAVGHVERFNAAPLELRRRLQEGQLGRLFTLRQPAARRSRPIADVGVVNGLDTHDIDLVSWLSGSGSSRSPPRPVI